VVDGVLQWRLTAHMFEDQAVLKEYLTQLYEAVLRFLRSAKCHYSKIRSSELVPSLRSSCADMWPLVVGLALTWSGSRALSFLNAGGEGGELALQGYVDQGGDREIGSS
jgi:hypothetical protein